MKIILTKQTINLLLAEARNGNVDAQNRIKYFESMQGEDKGSYLLLTPTEYQLDQGYDEEEDDYDEDRDDYDYEYDDEEEEE